MEDQKLLGEPCKVKVKPATALPWGIGPVFTKEGAALFYTDASKPGKWQRRLDDKTGVFAMDDAAYLHHAANAYPSLVEALRKARIALVMEGHHPGISAVLTDDIDPILRDLGEES